VHVVVADVTNEAQVQALAERVEAENPQGLYALVNNAGTSIAPPDVDMRDAPLCSLGSIHTGGRRDVTTDPSCVHKI
jgi:NAD(P)-dependent dehydrogenase (short-subunit alcohol dehydrogenase family)